MTRWISWWIWSSENLDFKRNPRNVKLVPIGKIGVGASRHEHNRNICRARSNAHMVQEAFPAHYGHGKLKQDDVRYCVVKLYQCIFAIRCTVNTTALRWRFQSRTAVNT